MLPSDYILSRALLFPPQRAYTISEGVTELIAVTDGPDGGRVLVTNGHPMSSTELLSQRYMRAMAHVPLLAHRQSRTRARPLLRCRQHRARGDAAPHCQAGRCRRSVAPRARALVVFHGGERRRAARSTRDRVHQRWAPSPADAGAGLLRPHHAGAASDRSCGRRGALHDGVLRARAHAADAKGLHQPVAAGVWRSAVDDPVDGPLVRRRLPQRRAALRRVIEPAAHRDDRRAVNEIDPIAADRCTHARSGRPGRPAAARPRHASRHRRNVRRVCHRAHDSDTGRAPRHR